MSLFFPLLAATSPTASPLLTTLVALVVVYLASKLGGELAVRLQLPAVLGELIFGVLVGVSGLRLLGSGNEVISVLAELGVILLLFEIGLESDLKELLRVGPLASLVATVGVAMPFLLGTAGLIWLFGVPVLPAVFAGAALTATSIGITARILGDLGKVNTTEGQVIIGAAILDDILGIIILAVVLGVTRDGAVSPLGLAYTTFVATGFLVAAIFLGRLFAPFFVKVVNRLRTRGDLIVSALVFAFTLAYLAQALGSEAILGSFAAGLVLAETEKRDDLERRLKPVADVFVPVFFVNVGATTDLSVLNPFNPQTQQGLPITLFLLVAAIVGKVASGYVLRPAKPVNRMAIGFGMIPRGEVGLIFVGQGVGVPGLNPALLTAIVIVVIVTTFLAPPLLRYAIARGGATRLETG
ncbi:cation:proton antiporter [Gloeobacter kilaueensis]|uniref:Na+/H+ antiporter n=1 Tax=Gloeobacter kilaueensis (strain ATCC BAA-2537 / CCAP 1431/1 / ULC 316 / JS1) TaxID=1183438 RepID=U5QMG6_GLOK1|nr:cation:proton antiporter [Gloeobacter kilaueensis]AGY60116.1 Na+/H+ antiporter [Gloeobacter kilaueensis JS1]